MYGWINGCLEDLILQNFDAETWQRIKDIAECEVATGDFYRGIHFSDESTYALVKAASEYLKKSVEELLILFGHHFIVYLDKYGYGRAVRSQGSTFREWIENVDEPHRLLRARFPKSVFPTLWIQKSEDTNDEGIYLHYKSRRKGGLAPIVVGIIKEVGSLYFQLDLEMELLGSEEMVSGDGKFHCWWRLTNCGPMEWTPKIAPEAAETPMDGTENSTNDTVLRCPFSQSTECDPTLTMFELKNDTDDTPQCPFNRYRKSPRSPTSPMTVREHSPKSSSRTSADGDSIGMSGEVFKRAFPFHIVVDQQLKVVQLGNTLLDLLCKRWHLPNILGENICEHFSITKPVDTVWSWQNLQRVGHSTCIELKLQHHLQTSSGQQVPISFRGQVEFLSAHHVAFLINPSVANMDLLGDLSLSLQDLPKHSFQADMLLIDEHLRSETCYAIELKRISNDLDKESRRAKHALKMKRIFVRYVSHEIRTPLNISILGLRCLEQEVLSLVDATAEQAKELTNANLTTQSTVLDTINTGNHSVDSDKHHVSNNNRGANNSMTCGEITEQLSAISVIIDEVKVSCAIAVEILNDLLLYEKIENGIFDMALVPTQMQDVVDGCVKLFGIQAKGAELRFEIDERRMILEEGLSYLHGSQLQAKDMLALKVNIDRSKVQQVLRNLFTNAVKFTPGGGSVMFAYAFFGLSAEDFRETPKHEARKHPNPDRRHHSNQNGNKHNDNDGVVVDDVDDDILSLPKKATYVPPSTPTVSFRRFASENALLPRDEAGVSGNTTSSQSGTSSDGSTSSSASSSSSSLPSTASSSSTCGYKKIHFAESVAQFPSRFVRLAISDTGPGISLRDQMSLFHEFIQVKADQLQNGQGSGLGLWIAATIVKMHGGRIGVYSAGEGQGATFVVDLPVYLDKRASASASTPLSSPFPSPAMPALKKNVEAMSATSATPSAAMKPVATSTATATSFTSSITVDPDAEDKSPIKNKAAEHIVAELSEAIRQPSPSFATTAARALRRINSMSKGKRSFQESTELAFAPHNQLSPHRTASNQYVGGSLDESLLTRTLAHGRTQLAVDATLSRSLSFHDDTDHVTVPGSALSSGSGPVRDSVSAQITMSEEGSTTGSDGAGSGPGLVTGIEPAAGFGAGMGSVLGSGLSALSTVIPHCSQDLRILIVDDVASNRKMVRRLVTRAFGTIDEAENGLMAVEKYEESLRRNAADVQNKPIDVIMMDFMMPLMNGPEATSRIKELARQHRLQQRAMAGTDGQATPEVIVVGVTGNGLQDDINAFLHSGADEVMVKPLDFGEFLKFLAEKHQIVLTNNIQK